MKLHEYQGKEITISYDSERCIHAKECVHGAPTSFDPNAKPWVHPDDTEPQVLAAVIQRCPTGALHYRANDPELAEKPPLTNSIAIQPDGPLYIRGNLSVRLSDGSSLAETRIALCRCGASERKPFCDNSHFSVTFLDPAIVPPGPDAEQEMATSGKLGIGPTADGPMHLQGQMTIRNSYNQVIFEGTETWLCRCGASANKPYCDGSHSRIGFKAD